MASIFGALIGVFRKYFCWWGCLNAFCVFWPLAFIIIIISSSSSSSTTSSSSSSTSSSSSSRISSSRSSFLLQFLVL